LPKGWIEKNMRCGEVCWKKECAPLDLILDKAGEEWVMKQRGLYERERETAAEESCRFTLASNQLSKRKGDTINIHVCI